MWRNLSVAATLAAALLCPLRTAAQDPAPGIALGLGALHWGMRVEEMASLFPDMRFSANVTIPGNPRTGTRGYQIAGCSFTLTAFFFRNAMDQFFLGAHDASESCREEILQGLETAFKLKASANSVAIPGDEYKYLSDGTTLVSYAYDSNNLLFPMLIYFEPLEDISGRHAAERLPPGDDFALGLQRLHWGMSPEMLKSVLPGLEFGAYGAFSATQSYDHAGCRLDLSLWFTHDGLDRLTVNAPMASAACEQEIVQELRNTFPLPVFTATNGTLSERRENHTTSAYYDEYRGGLFVDFSAKCQSIQVSVERVAAPAGTGPELVPDPDLSCVEYPPISVRLQEGGSVGLDVHVLNDGSVALATIVAPDKSRRINQAALRIAATRLRFTPASVKGEAVESEVTVKAVFAVIHPIHGQP